MNKRKIRVCIAALDSQFMRFKFLNKKLESVKYFSL